MKPNCEKTSEISAIPPYVGWREELVRRVTGRDGSCGCASLAASLYLPDRPLWRFVQVCTAKRMEGEDGITDQRQVEAVLFLHLKGRETGVRPTTFRGRGGLRREFERRLEQEASVQGVPVPEGGTAGRPGLLDSALAGYLCSPELDAALRDVARWLDHLRAELAKGQATTEHVSTAFEVPGELWSSFIEELPDRLGWGLSAAHREVLAKSDPGRLLFGKVLALAARAEEPVRELRRGRVSAEEWRRRRDPLARRLLAFLSAGYLTERQIRDKTR